MPYIENEILLPILPAIIHTYRVDGHRKPINPIQNKIPNKCNNALKINSRMYSRGSRPAAGDTSQNLLKNILSTVIY